MGAYNSDIHALRNCSYPEYIIDTSLTTYPPLPYFMPYRAFTNKQYENLIVSGKAMSQSFLT